MGQRERISTIKAELLEISEEVLILNHLELNLPDGDLHELAKKVIVRRRAELAWLETDLTVMLKTEEAAA